MNTNLKGLKKFLIKKILNYFDIKKDKDRYFFILNIVNEINNINLFFELDHVLSHELKILKKCCSADLFVISIDYIIFIFIVTYSQSRYSKFRKYTIDELIIIFEGNAKMKSYLKYYLKTWSKDDYYFFKIEVLYPTVKLLNSD